VSCAETLTAVAPDPAPTPAVFDPYAVDVPYSTTQVVDWPPGLTVPETVADDEPTAVAGPVVATGAAANAAEATASTRSTAPPTAQPIRLTVRLCMASLRRHPNDPARA
jgi:hypothetical protein